jgi:dTDP-4-dehydrorhamnose reductase
MRNKLELWGGVECTYNRVREDYHDQCERSGHANRCSDLELIAELGFKKLRYPVLWEKVAPFGVSKADWSWTDERLWRLHELGIEPIVGLLHHGSGPRHTSLLDPRFPDLFTEFAEAVAKRYPWIRMYVPINEPLTTARFSALYGHWYPHHRDAASFLRAVCNQCRAIIQSMRAIREINPNALLVQTEDMGKTYSTSKLHYQAQFENQRRWLSLDLLTGTEMDPIIVNYLIHYGINAEELFWFKKNACSPDIVGINHYVTSERFIDDDLSKYPEHSHGGNGKDSYADIEAIRVCSQIGNINLILRETWQRYQLPLAITDAHLGDITEEQQRWLAERWSVAEACLKDKIDVRAVTAWALLGSYDWNRLVKENNGHYEHGAFDVRSGAPESTGLAEMIKEINTKGSYHSPILDEPGWWQKEERIRYPLINLESIMTQAENNFEI